MPFPDSGAGIPLRFRPNVVFYTPGGHGFRAPLERKDPALRLTSFIAAVSVILAGAGTGFAQTPSRDVIPAGNGTALPDTVTTLRPPPAPTSAPSPHALRDVAPGTAMYHSMIVPGWGQLDNGRRLKALLFFATEAALIGGVIYEQGILNGGGLTKYERSVTRSDRNTFIIYWFGARVAGLVDAYVDAQLRGFSTADIIPAGLVRIPADSAVE